MKKGLKKHQITLVIIIVLILCVGAIGYLWYQHYCDKQITQAKEDIQYSNHVLSEFHKQKTLYQKVDFILNALPDSDGNSLFCLYGYSVHYPDNGWRNAKPITIKVSSTTRKYNTNGYEVIAINSLPVKESPQHQKNICSLLIEDRSNDQKKYQLYVNNDWTIVKYSTRDGEQISKSNQDKLLNIGESNVDLLFKTVETNIQQYKKDAEKVLKQY